VKDEEETSPKKEGKRRNLHMITRSIISSGELVRFLEKRSLGSRE